MELDSLIIKIQASAEGVDVGIQQAKTALQGLNSASAKHLAETKKVAAGAADAYRLAAMEAQAAAIKVKTANDDEKAAFEAAAKEAEKKAAILKIAAQEAQLAADQEARAFQSTADAAGKATVAYAAMAAAAAKAFQVIVQAAGTGIAAYNEQITVQQKLAHVMGNTMGARSSDVASINQLITAQEKLGVVSKSAQTAGAQELATYLTMGSSLQTLIPVMNDMAAQQFGIAASAEQVTNIATMLGKVMDGQVGGLSRYGYSFTEAQEEILKTGTEMERVAVLADVVSGSVGGMNEALAQTDAGKMEQASKATGDFSEALGGALSPAAGLAASMLSAVLSPVTELMQKAPGLAAGLTTVVVAITGFMGIQKAAEALSAFTGAAGAAGVAATGLSATIGAAMPIIAAISAVVGVGIGIYTQWKKAQDEAAEATRQAMADMQASIQQREDTITSVQALADEYETLSKKEGRTVAEKQRMEEIEKILAEQHGITAGAAGDLGGAYGGLTGAVREYLQALKEANVQETGEALALGVKALDIDLSSAQKALDDLKTIKAGIVSEMEGLDRDLKEGKGDPFAIGQRLGDLGIELASVEMQISNATGTLESAMTAYEDAAETGFANILAKMEAAGTPLSAGMQSALKEMYSGTVMEQGKAALTDEYTTAIAEAFASIDIGKANEAFAKVMEGVDLSEGIPADKKEEFKESLLTMLQEAQDAAGLEKGQLSTDAWDAAFAQILLGFGYVEQGADEAATVVQQGFSAAGESIGGAAEEVDLLAEALQNVNAAMGEADSTVDSLEGIRSQYQSIREEIEALQAEGGNEERIAQLEAEAENLEQQYEIHEQLLEIQQEKLGEEITRLENLQDENGDLEERLEIELQILEAAQQLAEIDAAKGLNIDSLEDIPAAVDPAVKALNDLGINFQRTEQQAKKLANDKALNKRFTDLAKDAKATKIPFDQFTQSLPAQQRKIAETAGSYSAYDAALKKTADALGVETDRMNAEVQGMKAVALDAFGIIEDGAGGYLWLDGTELDAEAQAAIERLEELLAKINSSGAGKGGGKKGGGGGGKKGGGGGSSPAREENKALEEQLKLLEQRKRIGEVNTRQEIVELQRIQAMYTRNAEERLRLEDMIFEARAKLRDEEIAQIDRLNEGIITALRNRYEAQRKLEQQNLDASIQNWQTWADETVKAIQAQIDALDEAEKQESRDEKEQKALRKIAQLKMELLYTTDEYDRHELEKEIARQEEDLSKQRREWAREDEKERLQAQIDAVQAQAQAEQDALQKKQEALDEVYDELTQTANLQAEAEKILWENNQYEIIQLIGSFAPEYEATGKTLGERLFAGLQSVMGDVSHWFDYFSAHLTDIQNQAAATANALSNQFYAGQLTGGLTGGSTPSSVSVEQTNNFNVPVPTASAVSDALDDAAYALAAQIAG